MKTDNTGKHACLSCGNDLAMPEDSVPGTIEDCKSFSKDGRFDEAIRVLNGMSESSPEILLLKLLCCYQVKSSGELLKLIEEEEAKILRS